MTNSPTLNLLRWLTSPSASEEIEREQQRRDFRRWLGAVSPAWRWDWAHLQFVRRYLERVTAGDLDRLMIFMPPRHGKSEMTTVRYPVWRLERDEGFRVAIGAYSQTFVQKFSRKARRIAVERDILGGETKAVDAWETVNGGTYRACAVGSPPTGEGFDLIVIDDPVRDRREANSEVYRELVWEWYTEGLYTRLEPGAAIVLIMTRWHQDDLAGRILNSEQAGDWEVISLPAEAEANDPLGRQVGEALCPERFDLDVLADRRATLGRAYYALYQQRPTPQEGDMFKRSWLRVKPLHPPVMDAVVRYWDKGATAGGGNYTAGVLMARKGGNYWILDVVRGQWSSYEREQAILRTTHKDARQWVSVAVWLEQEGGSGGKDSAAMTVRNLAGFNVRTETMARRGDKATRAEPLAAQAEAGNVYLVQAPWNDAYLDELCVFPHGKNDDQVDASSGAFNKLATPTGFYVT